MEKPNLPETPLTQEGESFYTGADLFVWILVVLFICCGSFEMVYMCIVCCKIEVKELLLKRKKNNNQEELSQISVS